MPTYKTRMLVALTDISLGPDTVAKDAVFSATDADADYLVRQKKAVEHGEVPLPGESAKVARAVKVHDPQPAEPTHEMRVHATAIGEVRDNVADTRSKLEPAQTIHDMRDEYTPPSELAVEPSDTSRTDLLELAAAVGLKVDGRWSDKRLADEIEFVTKA